MRHTEHKKKQKMKKHKRLAIVNGGMKFYALAVVALAALTACTNDGAGEVMNHETAEVQAIVSLRPMAGSPMCVARDLFVFQLYTGMSYSDTQRFDIRQYKKVDGVWTSNQERVKTGVAYVSVLLPPVVEVLERNGMQAPKIGNADYNHALKAIQMATGITTRLHSHLARHSFATWMLRNGVAMESLAKMMGHTTTRETQKYAKVTAQMVHEDFGRVARLFENDNKPQ